MIWSSQVTVFRSWTRLSIFVPPFPFCRLVFVQTERSNRFLRPQARSCREVIVRGASVVAGVETNEIANRKSSIPDDSMFLYRVVAWRGTWSHKRGVQGR